jgi:hypothetical protein
MLWQRQKSFVDRYFEENTNEPETSQFGIFNPDDSCSASRDQLLSQRPTVQSTEWEWKWTGSKNHA